MKTRKMEKNPAREDIEGKFGRMTRGRLRMQRKYKRRVNRKTRSALEEVEFGVEVTFMKRSLNIKLATYNHT